MNILPITNHFNFKKTSFKGREVLTYNYGGDNSEIETAKRAGLREEKTMGSFHPEHSAPYKIYYTDPLEKVNDRMRERYDYIFHDEEPAFRNLDEDVSKLYFFPASYKDKEKYKADLKSLREYFYRLEMSDSKTIGFYENQAWNGIDVANSRAKSAYFQDHVRDAKYNQETLAAAEGIFDEARELLDDKDRIYIRMEDLKKLIAIREDELPKSKTELANRKALSDILEKKIAELKKKEDFYKKIEANIAQSKTETPKFRAEVDEIADYNSKNHPEHSYYSMNPTFIQKPFSVNPYENASKDLEQVRLSEEAEQKEVAKLLKTVQININDFTKSLKSNNDIVKEIENYVKKLPNMIKSLTKELAEKTAAFEKAKADLIPHFDKLKNYVNSRGIRVIR